MGKFKDKSWVSNILLVGNYAGGGSQSFEVLERLTKTNCIALFLFRQVNI
jgi:hypothetical protein